MTVIIKHLTLIPQRSICFKQYSFCANSRGMVNKMTWREKLISFRVAEALIDECLARGYLATDFERLVDRLTPNLVMFVHLMNASELAALTGNVEVMLGDTKLSDWLSNPLLGVKARNFLAWSSNLDDQNGIFSRLDIADPPFSISLRNQDEYGRNMLHFAAWGGQFNTVKFLIEKQNFVVEKTDNIGRNSAHYAAWADDVTTLDYLFTEFNLQGETPDSSGCCVLHYAASSHGTQVIQFLLDSHGVNPDATDKKGHGVFYHAARKANIKALKYLYENQEKLQVTLSDKENVDALHAAAKSGDVETLKYLIDSINIPCESLDACQQSALHHAAAHGNIEAVKYLIEERSMVCGQLDKFDRNALHHAAENGYLAVVTYFVEHQSMDPNKAISDGCNPLHLAVTSGHLNIAQYLIEVHGLSALQKNQEGLSAHTLAIKYRRTDLCNYFQLSSLNMARAKYLYKRLTERTVTVHNLESQIFNEAVTLKDQLCQVAIEQARTAANPSESRRILSLATDVDGSKRPTNALSAVFHQKRGRMAAKTPNILKQELSKYPEKRLNTSGSAQPSDRIRRLENAFL